MNGLAPFPDPFRCDHSLQKSASRRPQFFLSKSFYDNQRATNEFFINLPRSKKLKIHLLDLLWQIIAHLNLNQLPTQSILASFGNLNIGDCADHIFWCGDIYRLHIWRATHNLPIIFSLTLE